MGLRINQNIAAMNAYRNLSVTDSQMSKSLEKLSSGFRINRAADDAAGLSISEGLRSQVGGLKVAVRNAQDGVNVVQTADGALTETHAILQRMRDLAVQASNSGSQDTSAKQAAQTEFSQLNSELDRIGNTTAFGGQKLLDGTFGASASAASTNAAWTNKTVGATNDFKLTTNVNGASQTVNVSVAATTYTSGSALAAAVNAGISTALKAVGGTGNEVSVAYQVDGAGAGGKFVATGTNSFTTADGTAGASVLNSALGIANGAYTASGSGGVFQVGANNTASDKISVSIGKVDSTSLGTNALNLVSDAGGAIDTIDSAIKSVSTTRANLGAYQNRFEHTINNLNVAVQNLSASESQIRDTDMAQEMTQFTRAQILSQAGTSMLAQANQSSQSVLKLLG